MELSFPGRSPASVNSLARCTTAFFVEAFGVCALSVEQATAILKIKDCKPRSLRLCGRTLPLAQNRIQARFKIVFTLAPQFTAFHRQRRFYRLHPAEQFLDVLARLLVIQLQIFPAAHPVAKSLLERVVRSVEGVFCRARSQQSAVPGEQMLEAQISHEMPGALRDFVVVKFALADQHQWLRG